MGFPNTATYRSRMLIPSEGLKYQTLTASDLAFNTGNYTTFTGVQNGTDIDITLAGNFSTSGMDKVAFANFDTQIPSDPTSDTAESWLCSIYLSFDTSSFTGSENQNLGVYFFTGDPASVGVGTGYYGGGCISETSAANRSITMYDYVQRKNASFQASLTTDVVTTATQMTMTAQIVRGGNGGNGAFANKINSRFANMMYGNASGWDVKNKIESFNYQTATGSNLQIGIWASRNTSGAFSHDFTINEFSYALLLQKQ